MHNTKPFAVAITALALSACGGNPPVVPPSGELPSGSTVPSATGGTVSGPNGVQVVIPAGALPSDTKITITQTSVGAPSQQPAGVNLGMGGTVYQIEPHGVTFSTPVTVRLPIPAGVTDPTVYVSEPDTGWYPQAFKVNNGFVEVQRSGFSYYRVGEEPTHNFEFKGQSGMNDGFNGVTCGDFQNCIWSTTWRFTQDVQATVALTAYKRTLNTASLLPDCSTPNVLVSIRPTGMTNWTALPTLPMNTQNLDSSNHYFGSTGPASLATFTYTPKVAETGDMYLALSCNGVTEFNKLLGIKIKYTVNPSYAVKGSVTGLPTGTSLTLSNNGKTATTDGNGNFAFLGLSSGTAYNVTIPTQPNGYNCTVSNGKGTLGSTDVSNVTVSCTPLYTIAGTASLPNGSSGVQLTVESTKHASETIPAAASFSFATQFSSGDDYKVTFSAPANLKCSVSNGSGTISGNVSNVTVSCAPAHTIGGTVSGLTSGLFDTAQLQLNGGESFYKRNGSFAFTTTLSEGETYTVSIPSQGNSTCKITGGTGTIAADGYSITGTMGSADISDIAVTCTQP